LAAGGAAGTPRVTQARSWPAGHGRVTAPVTAGRPALACCNGAAGGPQAHL
jgi:hypothetical protein